MSELNLEMKVKAMISQQKLEWDLAKTNYSGLDQVEVRSFDFDGFKITAQFNPERIRSSGAKLDAASIQQRACFLCESNRPTKQAGVDFEEKYTILINPYPIFAEHLTIPLNQHLVQEIEPYISDMLDLSHALPGFTVFYNGPKCGASAPDHFHFQAARKELIPINQELDIITERLGEQIFQSEFTTIHAIGSGFLRNFLLFTSSSSYELHQQLLRSLEALKKQGQEGEPMLNLLLNFDNGKWIVLLFPRDKQRPDQFYMEDESQIMMSPASVELAGMAILPRKEDFDKMTKETLADIYRQVTINDPDFDRLKKTIQST